MTKEELEQDEAGQRGLDLLRRFIADIEEGGYGRAQVVLRLALLIAHICEDDRHFRWMLEVIFHTFARKNGEQVMGDRDPSM